MSLLVKRQQFQVSKELSLKIPHSVRRCYSERKCVPLFQLRVEEISLRNLYLLVLNHACICLIGTYAGPQNVSFVCLFFCN